MPFASNLGTGGQALNAQYGSTSGSNTNQPLLLSHSGTNYLYLPGVSGNYVTVPDCPALDITGDIDIRARVALTDWTPSGAAYVVAKWTPGSNQKSYALVVNTNGTLWLRTSPNGSTEVDGLSSVASGIADGSISWIRATLDVDDGAGNRVYTFYTSTDGTTWTQLGTTVTVAGTTSIFNSSSTLDIGGFWSGSQGNQPMSVYRAQVLSGIGGTVALDVDFTTGVVNGGQTSVPVTGTAANQIQFAQVLTNSGSGGPILNAQVGSAVTTTTNDPITLEHFGTNYLYLPGTQGSTLADNRNGTTATTWQVSFRANWAARGGYQTVLNRAPNSGALFGVYLDWAGLARPRVVWTNSSGVSQDSDYMGTTALPVGELIWFRFTVNAAGANTIVTVETAPDSVSEPTVWTTHSTVTRNSTTGILFPNTNAVIGALGYSVSTFMATMSLYQLIERIDGTITSNVNFTTGITSGAQTTVTATTGQTFTIGRATSGLKTVAVTRPTLLFGTDDYLEVPDHDLLDFGASDSFTVIAANRSWATSGNEALVAKKNNFATNDLGWAVGRSATSTRGRMGSDTLWYSSNVDAAGSYGDLTLSGLVVVANTSMTIYNNATATNSTTPPSGSFINTFNVRIGSTPTGTFFNGEVFGVAVWRRALTPTEIALVNTHYQTGPTTESIALLSESVLWIDPARSKSAASIIRSANNRKSVAVTRNTWLLGSDGTSGDADYFQIPDNDLLDFSANQSFSIVAAYRQWSTARTAGRYFHKGTGIGARFGLAAVGTTTQGQVFINDGTNSSAASAPAHGVGALVVTTGVVDRSSQTVKAYLNTTSGASAGVSTVGSPSTANVARSGADASGTSPQDFELYGLAVFRRALTDAEIATISDYYRR